MEHENAYLLMMDALDGELTDAGEQELAVHLRACPTCTREWQALTAIDTLFRQTPALAPAADFTQRTLARLPNRRYRVWMLTAIYFLLLLGGALPMLIGIWAFSELRPVLGEPALWQTLYQALNRVVQVVGTVLAALLDSVGEFVVQQPAVVGWLLVMAGVVFLWSGVFRQLVLQPSNTQS